VDSPLEDYLTGLRREFRGNPLLARRVLEEVRDHLALAADEERRSGMSPFESEQKAVERFGPASQLARKFDRFGLAFRALLILCALATILVGLWLMFVITFILPSRDPEHIKLWGSIAACFFAYSGLTLLYLFRGPRSTWLRRAVVTLSFAAIAAGAYGIVNMIEVGRSGGHFEGYIVLMGLVIAGHGVVALLYTVLTRRLARAIAIGETLCATFRRRGFLHGDRGHDEHPKRKHVQTGNRFRNQAGE
jgi:hypothetical protein